MHEWGVKVSKERAAAGILAFLEDATDAPEVLWAAGVAMIRRAASEAEEGRFGRLRHYPRGELRRARRDLAQGLRLLRIAAALIEADDERDSELAEELHARAVEAGRARRRAQTMPAQVARLAKAQERAARRYLEEHGGAK